MEKMADLEASGFNLVLPVSPLTTQGAAVAAHMQVVQALHLVAPAVADRVNSLRQQLRLALPIQVAVAVVAEKQEQQERVAPALSS
jgi:hypothetical protein